MVRKWSPQRSRITENRPRKTTPRTDRFCCTILAPKRNQHPSLWDLLGVPFRSWGPLGPKTSQISPWAPFFTHFPVFPCFVCSHFSIFVFLSWRSLRKSTQVFATYVHVCSVCVCRLLCSMFLFRSLELPVEIYASFVWVVAGVSHDFFFSDV